MAYFQYLKKREKTKFCRKTIFYDPTWTVQVKTSRNTSFTGVPGAFYNDLHFQCPYILHTKWKFRENPLLNKPQLYENGPTTAHLPYIPENYIKFGTKSI